MSSVERAGPSTRASCRTRRAHGRAPGSRGALAPPLIVSLRARALDRCRAGGVRRGPPPERARPGCHPVFRCGTTVSDLAHGLPLVIVPLFADQPHNAGRAVDIGAGITLPAFPSIRAAWRGAPNVLETLPDAVRIVLD